MQQDGNSVAHIQIQLFVKLTAQQVQAFIILVPTQRTNRLIVLYRPHLATKQTYLYDPVILEHRSARLLLVSYSDDCPCCSLIAVYQIWLCSKDVFTCASEHIKS